MLPSETLVPGGVAQLVEQGSHNPCVGSSILPAATARRPPAPREVPAVVAFERAVLASLRRQGLLPRGERIVVAVSGGGDSTALLLVLDALARRHGEDWRLLVAHLDHGLRGHASAEDAAFVARLAERLGHPFCTAVARPRQRGQNLEAWARAERSHFLKQAARQFGATSICLGHTQDDQAETVLLRLARGAGPASLAGMHGRRSDGVVRPLLDRSRAECASYVQLRGVVPRHDSTNDEDRFFRNRIRRYLLPELTRCLGVDAVARLARLAEDLRVEAQLADERIAELLGASEESLSVDVVREAGQAAGRLVHTWLARRGVRGTRAQVEGVVRIARGARPSARIDLAGGRVVLRCYGALEIATRDPAASLAPVPWPVPGSAQLGEWSLRATLGERGPVDDLWSLRVSLVEVGAGLEVRPPRPGDRMILRGGTRKVSDILVDARVARSIRAKLAVVTSAEGRVLWIPGVAARAAVDSLKTNGATTAVLRVEKGLPDFRQRGKNPVISGENCRARV